MDYKPDYSRTQVHFAMQPPDWRHLLEFRKPPDAILDLGAGGGRNSIYLRQIYPQSKLVPCDLSLIRCKACRNLVNSEVVCGNSMTLPFRDGSFDFVVSTQVIEHVPDDVVFVQEVKRVLKPGGIAIVSSVLKQRFGWYFYRNDVGQWVLDPTHVREYRSVEEYTALFSNLFPSISVDLTRYQFSPARFLYRLLIKIGIIKKPNSRFFVDNKWGQLLGKWQIVIPRYQNITIVAEKS